MSFSCPVSMLFGIESCLIRNVQYTNSHLFCTHFHRIANLAMMVLFLSDNRESCDHKHSFQQTGQFRE
jgi:hypothetical protein